MKQVGVFLEAATFGRMLKILEIGVSTPSNSRAAFALPRWRGWD
jgi:hypothetical protein